MRLLDLIEQHDLVRPPAHRLGQGAALLVADIARRRADQAGHRMLFHIFRHIDADHRLIIIEQEGGQGAGQFGFADTGRAEEQERADRPVRILQPGARAAHRVGNRDDGLLLADDAFAERILHRQQFFALALEHLVNGNAGPARDHSGDVVLAHLLVEHPVFRRRLAFRQAAFEIGDHAVGQFAGAFEIAFALHPLQLATRLVELLLQSLGIAQLILFRLPGLGEFLRARFERAQLFL